MAAWNVRKKNREDQERHRQRYREGEREREQNKIFNLTKDVLQLGSPVPSYCTIVLDAALRC